MITVAKIVAEMLYGDEVAREALSAGVLNLSAYAKKLKPKIDIRLYKDTRLGSIVTALSRLASISHKVPSLKVVVKIEDMSIKSPLCELTYEKTKDVGSTIANLGTKYSGQGFFTATNGIGEITLIVSQSFKEDILREINIKPKGQYDDLAAITVRFTESEYIEIPNMIYTLVSALAVKRINLIEIVSTYTEISFIVRQGDMNDVIEVFKTNFLNT